MVTKINNIFTVTGRQHRNLTGFYFDVINYRLEKIFSINFSKPTWKIIFIHRLTAHYCLFDSG